MESSSHRDQLLDLLYGELSPEQEAELRRAIADDDDLAERWQQLKKAHGEVRKHVPEPQQVPVELQDAIMDAAKTHANDGPKRRGAGPTSTDGGWSTLVSSGRVWAGVSMAAVLLASATLYTVYSSMEQTVSPEAQRSVAVADEPTYQAPATEEVAAVDKEVEAREAEEAIALSESVLDELAEDEGAELARDLLAAHFDDRSEDDEDADEEADEPEEILALRDEPSTDPEPMRRQRSARAPSPRPTAQPERAVPESEPQLMADDLFAEEQPQERAARPETEEDSTAGLGLAGAGRGGMDSAGVSLDSDSDRGPTQRERARAEESVLAGEDIEDADDAAEPDVEKRAELALAGEVEDIEEEDSEEVEETEPDPSTDQARALLEAAQRAHREGDSDGAQTRLRQLYDEGLDEALDDDERSEAQALESSLEIAPSEEVPAEADERDATIEFQHSQ